MSTAQYMKVKTSHPNGVNISVKDDKFVQITKKGELHHSFPITNFSDFEIDCIKTHKVCGGCKTLPLTGFHHSKRHWCAFSRKIASLEENALSE
jgi:hypothetical protein